jgi:hypoxanthine phosphoribosyltransferase
MQEEKLTTVLSEDEIATRIKELASEIRSAYEGEQIAIVGLLEDSFVFLADLIRALNVPVTCSFLKATKHESGGHTDIHYTSEFDTAGRHILLVGGILDTGVTINYIVRQLAARGAKDIKTCFLIDKPNFRTTEFAPDFVGFSRNDDMIFGYGLGLRDNYRYLPYLAKLDQ